MHGSESRQASMRLNEKEQERYVAMLWLCFSGEHLQESGHLGGEGVQIMLVEQKKINDYRGTSMDIGQAHDLYANQKKKSLFMLNKTSPKEITPS